MFVLCFITLDNMIKFIFYLFPIGYAVYDSCIQTISDGSTDNKITKGKIHFVIEYSEQIPKANTDNLTLNNRLAFINCKI